MSYIGHCREFAFILTKIGSYEVVKGLLDLFVLVIVIVVII